MVLLTFTVCAHYSYIGNSQGEPADTTRPPSKICLNPTQAITKTAHDFGISLEFVWQIRHNLMARWLMINSDKERLLVRRWLQQGMPKDTERMYMISWLFWFSSCVDRRLETRLKNINSGVILMIQNYWKSNQPKNSVISTSVLKNSAPVSNSFCYHSDMKDL